MNEQFITVVSLPLVEIKLYPGKTKDVTLNKFTSKFSILIAP